MHSAVPSLQHSTRRVHYERQSCHIQKRIFVLPHQVGTHHQLDGAGSLFSPALVLDRGRPNATVFGYSERLLGRHERSGPWSPFPIFRSSAWSRHTWSSSPATSATSASPRNAREKVDGGLGRTGAALSPRWAWPFPSSSRSSSSPSTCSLPSACAKALSPVSPRRLSLFSQASPSRSFSIRRTSSSKEPGYEQRYDTRMDRRQPQAF